MVSNKRERIKILYIVTKGGWGGAQKYVYDLSTNLPKESYNVSVAIGGSGKLKDKLCIAGIKTFTLNKLGRNINIFHDISVFFSILKLLHTEQPDIIHLNSPKAGGLGALAGRIAGVKKIIYTGHGWAWNEDRNILQRKTIHLLSFITILLSHKTIAISKYDLDVCKNMSLVKNKIVVIYNGISKIHLLDKVSARNTLMRSINKKINDSFVWIGSIGELHKNKGFVYAIEALSILLENNKNQNLIFFIIGSGEEKENLEKLIIKKGLENHIFIVKKEENAYELLNAFDIFIISSIKEGLPYTLLEAGLASKPVIATSVGGIPEIVENMKSGILLPQKNAFKIAEAVSFITSPTGIQYRFGKKLNEKIVKEFSLDNMIQNTIKIYCQ